MDTQKLFTDIVQMNRTNARQIQLLDAAKRALNWLDNYNRGTARNSQHDSVLIARALFDAIANVELGD